MDPHFTEYLAAIAGMHDIYGETGDDRPSEFHEVSDEPLPFLPRLLSIVAGLVAFILGPFIR